MKDTTEVITFGCRLNTYESQIIKDNIKLANLEDAVVFNTCAVTQEAQNEAIKSIAQYKKKNPNKKIIVTGCAAQIDSKFFAAMPEVDLVLGNQAKLDHNNYKIDKFDAAKEKDSHHSLGSEMLNQNNLMSAEQENEIHEKSHTLVDPSITSSNINKRKIITSNIFKETEVNNSIITNIEGKTRAFIQIQNGCDHFCTFCIIPRGRGKNRAAPVAQIVNQISVLMDQGYKEIVFTGVDITDYGKNIPGNPSLAKLIKRVFLAIPNFTRLRLSSVDVAEIDDELFELLAYEKRIMPHFHISIQSGDDTILGKMKRRHCRQQVIDFCQKLRKLRPEVSFGADIIVGFPTETDEMFQNTCDIVSQAGLQFLHIFPYSIRKDTPAAKMEQVEDSIKKQRAKILKEIGNIAKNQFMQSMNGKTLEVLVENNLKGKTNNFCSVALDESFKNKENQVHFLKLEFIENKLYGKTL